MSATGRTLLVVFAVTMAGTSAVRAQEPGPGASAPDSSLERVRAGLQSAPASTTDVGAPTPATTDTEPSGVVTFVPPEAPGQFIGVRVPVGTVATRAVRSVAAARHRRAENAARDEVRKALAEFLGEQPK